MEAYDHHKKSGPKTLPYNIAVKVGTNEMLASTDPTGRFSHSLSAHFYKVDMFAGEIIRSHLINVDQWNETFLQAPLF